jgi:hypothetical protein
MKNNMKSKSIRECEIVFEELQKKRRGKKIDNTNWNW